jgi:cephalosporin-C deacetylase-like acetyl esterase
LAASRTFKVLAAGGAVAGAAVAAAVAVPALRNEARRLTRLARPLAALEPWVRGEFHRGYSPDLAGAGRALSTYDGRPLAEAVDVPCAVVVTISDQLVRPEKQYALADALAAETFTLHGDTSPPSTRARPSPRPSGPPSTR